MACDVRGQQALPSPYSTPRLVMKDGICPLTVWVGEREGSEDWNSEFWGHAALWGGLAAARWVAGPDLSAGLSGRHRH